MKAFCISATLVYGHAGKLDGCLHAGNRIHYPSSRQHWRVYWLLVSDMLVLQSGSLSLRYLGVDGNKYNPVSIITATDVRVVFTGSRGRVGATSSSTNVLRDATTGGTAPPDAGKKYTLTHVHADRLNKSLI